MTKSIDTRADISASVRSAIQETERYYREQIFSSGCSSLVPIYRINDNTLSQDALIHQLEATPYIQKDVEFSPKVIDTLMDVQLYRYKDRHFFFQGDVRAELANFVAENCSKIDSVASLVQSQEQQDVSWKNIDANLSLLIASFPVLEKLDLTELTNQIDDIVREIKFDSTLVSYLNIFSQPEWDKKLRFNQSSLLSMVAIANTMQWDRQALKELIILGLLKDIGYVRLSDKIADFEVLHPLVSHSLVKDLDEQQADEELKLAPGLLDAILTHHEFCDGSGPLARMRHPLVTQCLKKGMPKSAQISGLCDLYFGFKKKYSPGLAFSITCGFVLGQGEVPARYEIDVISAFVTTFKNHSYLTMDISAEEGEVLLESIVNVLKNPVVKKNASDMVRGKSDSWYERVTLALNIVRNIAQRQPEQMSERSLVDALYLPAEFGLNY